MKTMELVMMAVDLGLLVAVVSRNKRMEYVLALVGLALRPFVIVLMVQVGGTLSADIGVVVELFWLFSLYRELSKMLADGQRATDALGMSAMLNAALLTQLEKDGHLEETVKALEEIGITMEAELIDFRGKDGDY